MGWNRHDCAGAVAHQNEVCDEYWHAVARKRMNGLQPGIHTEFFHGRHVGFCNLNVALLFDKRLQGRVARSCVERQRVLRRNGNIANTHESVWPCCVYRQRGEVGVRLTADTEAKLDAFGAADPIRLHGANLLRPATELVEVGKQFIAEVCNLDKPLRNFAAFNERARPPAASINDLLVGEYGLVYWIPVHLGFFLVGEPFLKEACEEPLLPAIIVGVAGGQFAVPVVGVA